MKKSKSNNYFRRNIIGNKNEKNDENKTKLMKNSFDNMCYFYKEIQNNIISSDVQIQKIKYWYKCFLDEMNKLKTVIEKFLANKSKTLPYSQKTNTPPEKETVKEIYINLSPKKNQSKSPPKSSYQTNSIKLDTIRAKTAEIREKIKKYSLKFEDDENNIPKRNKYLETVANISGYAIEYSYKLIDILKTKFKEKNKFKSIIYERAKEEFSSWVNQTLLNESAQNKNFFEKNCNEELKISSLNRIILKDNFNLLSHYKKLFIDLCELFTLVLLFSEKEIELKFFERGAKYQHDEMKDITELNGIRYVNFTVLPGFVVNQKSFQFAKAVVFCEYDTNPKLHFNIKIPKKFELVLQGTIKTKEINDKINIKFYYQKQKDSYAFNIKTEPEIPKEDNPLFLMRYYINSNWQYFRRGMNQSLFYIKKSDIPQNSFIAFDIQINGIKKVGQRYIGTDKILNS